MQELLRRLLAQPLLFTELAAASLFVNILGLSTSLYVIQIFNRYVAHGVTGTLATLTVGVVLALALELSFRRLRLRIAGVISSMPDSRLSNAAYNATLSVKNSALIKIPANFQQEMMRGLNKIQDTYSPANLNSFLDLPFAFLIVFILYLLSPILSLIAFFGVFFAIVTGLVGQKLIRTPTKSLLDINSKQASLTALAVLSPELVRAFNGQPFFAKRWRNYAESLHDLKQKIRSITGSVQSVTTAVTSLLTVGIIGTGASQVLSGDLSLGALIGANILAARALNPAIRFMQLSEQLAEAKQALINLTEFSRLPSEPALGSTPKEYKGSLMLQDMAFAYQGSPAPLFESFDINIRPGEVVAVIGPNGSGKTSLARLLLGILEPLRGQILIDGVSLQQISLPWWRQQVIYLPQEPMFFNGTIRENILLSTSRTANEIPLDQVVRAADLKNFLDSSPDGLETVLSNNGQNLSLGMRRRLAIARALVSAGRLVVFDEPTEGLDATGQMAVYSLLNDFLKQGRTIIVFSHDKNIIKGAQWLIDLSHKPVPTVRNLSAKNGDPAE